MDQAILALTKSSVSEVNTSRDSLNAEAVLRFEGAYAGRLKGNCLSQAQVGLLNEFFATCSTDELEHVVTLVIKTIPEYPPMSELVRLLAEYRNRLADEVKNLPPVSFDDLARGPAPWWFKRQAVLMGIKGMTRVRMEKALLAESWKRGDVWAVDHFTMALRLAEESAEKQRLVDEKRKRRTV